MSNLDLSQFSPLGLDSLDSIGAIEPITPQKRQSGQSSSPKLTGNITEFVKSAGPAAARVAKNLGVPVEAVLGQWGLETGWGKSVIPGTNNLGNIKDFSGKGVAATDNMTGSRDRYRQYGSVDEFADDFSRLLKNKRYSAALGSQDAETYFSILKQGGYAEDPSYVQKGKHAASLVSEAIKKAGITELSQSQDRQGQQAKQKGGGLSDVTPWNVIEQTPQYKGLSDEEKTAAKELYFDRLISPHIDQSSAIDMRKRFLERKDREGGVSFWDIAKGIVENHLPYKSAMEGFTPDSSSKRELPSPANTDARRQIEAVWDAASKDERAVLEKRQDWVGDIARSKAQSYKQIDRSTNTVPNLATKVAGGLSDLDTRVESRTSRLIGAGENPIAAKRMAIDAARAGANPGMETIGSASLSSFDFDTARLFDPNAESNGLNNALVRGLAKGGAGAVKSLAGVAQSGYDLLRSDSKGAFAASVGDWARNKEAAIGERGDFLTRNFEGAVNSLSQQLPLLIAGVATGSAAIPLAGMAVQSFGREYSDSRAKGQSGDKAAARAAIFAAFEVVGERFGLKHNMDAIRAAADGMPTDQVLSFLAGALKREIPGELLTTTGQFATDKWAPRGIGLRPDYTSEDYLAQVADTIAQTVMQSGMMTAGTTGMAGAVRYMNGEGAPQPQSGVDLGSAPQDVQQGGESQVAGTEQETADMAQPPLDIETNPIAQPVAEESLSHPSEEVADKIVQEMAEAAGVPLDIVLPAPQQTTNPVATDGEQVDSEVSADISDADVLQFAATRARELTGKRDGSVDTVVSENGLVDVEEAGGLTEAESKELSALVAAGSDIQKIKALYGLNQTESNNDQAEMEAQQAAPISAVQADAAPASTPQQDQQQSAQPEIRQFAPRAKEPNPQELDLSQRTDEELAFYARNASSKSVLRAVANERARRKQAAEAEKATEVKTDAASQLPANNAVSQETPKKKPKTEKERNQMANYDDKWFMSKEKAEAFIRKKRIDETHEAVSGDGGKFLIKRKADHLRDTTKMVDAPASQDGAPKTTVAGRNEPKVDQVESEQQDELDAEMRSYERRAEERENARSASALASTPSTIEDRSANNIADAKRSEAPTPPKGKSEKKKPSGGSKLLQELRAEREAKKLKQEELREFFEVEAARQKEYEDLPSNPKIGLLRQDEVGEVTGAIRKIDENTNISVESIAATGGLIKFAQKSQHAFGSEYGSYSISKSHLSDYRLTHRFEFNIDGKYRVLHWEKKGEDPKERFGEFNRDDWINEATRIIISEAEIRKPKSREETLEEVRQLKAKIAQEEENGGKEWDSLTPAGRRTAIKMAKVRLLPEIHWRHIKPEIQEKLRPVVLKVLADSEKGQPSQNDADTQRVSRPDIEKEAREWRDRRNQEKSAAPESEESAASQKMAIRQMIKKGDTIVLSRSIEYAGANTPFLVEGVNKYKVFILNKETGGRTSINLYAIQEDDLLSVEDTAQRESDLLYRRGAQINSKRELDAASRLEALHEKMGNITNRNTREGDAKAAVKGVIDELRKPKTVVQVIGVLERASESLRKSYGAFSDVIDEVMDSLSSVQQASLLPENDATATPASQDSDIAVNDDAAEEVTSEITGKDAGAEPAKTESGSPKTQDNKTEQDSTEQSKPSVSANVIFTEDAAAKARELLKRKLNGSTLNSGIDPEVMQAGITLAGYHIEKGARTFAAYAKAMVSDLGDVAKPYLKSWYMGVKYDPRASGFDGMDSAAVVDELDIDTIFASKDKAQQEESGNDSTAKPKPARNPSQGERNPQQRPSLQPGATRQDQEGVAAESAKNDEPATGPENSGRSGTGAADGDVGVGGGLQSVGDAADGRTRAGGKRVANAGSGKRARVSTSSASNYHIADPEQLIGGTPKVRFSRNKAAIEAYQSISSEGRQPTKEELDAMAAYIGWGSFGQELFKGTYEYPRPKDGWQAESDWIREHLGKDGWESAQRSIINAHYTDPITVGAMWDMVRQLGFTGGKVLEPSMGVGNFFGLMPRDLMENSRLTGIEMEQTTGGMAKILYPDANIQIKPYQDSKTADGFYDLVIGNWPFAKDGPADRRYMSLNPSLHDYFFLKALDQTREGGIVIGITSAGTMDKKNSLVRAKMAEKADLIAAYRLPSGAFEKYAGTSVVTDIIILKRRDNKKSSASDSGWLRAVEVKTPDGAVTVNEYFANNPDKILGQLGFGSGSTYGRPSMIVRRPDDLEKRLTGIAKTLPAGVFEPQTTESITDRFVTNNIADRDMAVVVSKDGRLMQIQGEYLAPLEDVVKNFKLKDAKKTKAREQQITELVSIRRLYGELVDSERDGLPDTEKKRTSLRDAHAKFVKAHGPITKSTGLSILKKAEDPFFPVLAALESPDGTPAAIMSKPTVRSQKQIDNPSVTDALVLARNESLNISMSRIAQIAGVSEDVAAKELVGTGAVFKTPSGNYEIADVYLSGNVRRKLREAEDALEQGDTDMKRNIAALKEVVPEDIPYFNIEAKLGATWVGADTYVEFFSSLLGVAPTSAIDVRWAGNRWKVKLSADLNARPEATTTWGHQSVKFDKILNAAMGNTTITIKYKDDEGNLVVDEDASAEVAEKIGKVRDEFSSWLWSDPVRKIEMEQAYNEAMNAIALPRFDGSFLTFAGMALQRGESPFNLRKHQVDAIWRGLANGRSLNAHEVGTGKTYTMGGLAVESRRYGIAKKPLIFAHNANSSSVAREIGEMYPGAKLLYVDNLAPERVPTVLRQIANDDWDAIIVPHSVIDKFTLKKETLLEISQEQINALEMEAIDAASEDGSSLSVSDMNDPEAMKKVRSSTAKQLVHARNAIIKKIEDMALKSSKENAVSFEDMGVDMIIVDEAHEFKKPSIATRMKMKGLNTSPSSKSISLMFLTDYVKKKNGGRGVHLFTGTPITNTLSEIYNMMRYIMDDQMEKDGIKDWDAWFNTFADSTSDVELTATGEYEPVSRLASFVNVSELRRMIGQYMDIVFADDMPEFKPRNTSTGKTLSSPDLTEQESNELLNGRSENPIGRPYKKVVTDVAEMTPDQSEILSKLQGLAAKFKSATKKERREIMLRGGPESPVLVETAAANAGLDARLYDITAKDTPLSKVNRATARILHHYNEHPLATQVVFVERGFSDSSESRKKNKETGEVTVTVSERFNLVSDLIDKLERGGIPREQIAIVDGSTSKEKRKAIADAMNRAEIRVVIGNSRTLGVGVNMQTNLRAMHHLDAPWMPGDLEQRNGRGHRQGNKLNTVLEYRYLTERIDGRRWQVLSVKDRFIKAFLKAKSDVRVIDGDALSSEGDDISSTLSEAAGDPRLLMLNKLRSDVLKLEAKERMHAQAIFDAKNKIKQINREIADNEGRIKRFEAADAAFRSKVKGDLSVVVKGVTHKDTEAANNALKIAVDSVPSPQMEPIKLGSIWGFEMEMIWRSRMDTPRYMVTVDGLMVEFGKPSVESVRQTLYGLQNTIKRMKEANDESLESLPRLEEATKAPFARADDLKRKKDLFNSIEKDIQVNPVPAPSWLRNGAPVGVEVFVSGKPVVVEGHRWTSEGYFVTVTDQDATRDVDYLEVKDAAGFDVYDAHPFASPEVKQQTNAPAALRPAGGVLPASRRMSVEEIGAIVADRLAKFPRRPDVSIRESVTDVAPWLEAGSAAGAVIDGKIYLFRDALASAEDVTETLWHEILHYGVRKVLSKQGFIAEMSKLYQADPAIKTAADTWMKTSEASRVSQLHGAAYARAMAVEEAVADVAGSGKANSVPTSVFDAIVGWALKVADRLGFSAFAKKHRGKTGIDAREFVRGIFGQIQSGAADKAIVSELVIEPAFLMGQVRDGLVRYFGETQQLKTFNAYHKTLATQYHKAQIDKHYGKVFTLVTDMQNHVSLASIRPAELAASVLPRADSVKESFKTLIKGRPSDDPILKAADAIFAGTLNGKDVLDGKVWSDDELRSKFSMNDSEIAVYRQVRSAIDASLDELAAAEAFAVAQSFIPPEMRKAIVDNPSVAQESIVSSLTSQEKVLKQVVDAAKKQGDEESAKRYAAQRDVLLGARRRVNKIFAMSNKLKLAGYAPLMRFGEFTVTVEATDPNTGEVLRTNGKSVVEYFGKYDTESEALAAKKEMEEAYRGRDFKVSAGVASRSAHELYAGVSPETVAIFGEAVGAGEIAEKYYQLVLSERNALKRRIGRKGIAGYSEELPRVLSNFITSNARFAAQRLYLRDINSTIKSIPREKGDVLDEAIAMKKFVLDPNDPAAPVSSAMFAMFLGGSISAALVNMSQPMMMTAPYLSQFGQKIAATAITKAIPFALGKKQADEKLREALKRASQEGVVDAQEVFHLYSLGSQALSSRISGSLSKLPLVGGVARRSSASVKARAEAFMTLWGSMFSIAESFNRRLTFVAAWDVALKIDDPDPYAFAVRAVNETQGIYNKVNRPNWARNPAGRILLTFKQYSIGYLELISRMWKRGGPGGKKAVLVMLGVLLLMSGLDGLPFAQDLDDLIDTIGQLVGFDTNAKRTKMELAHELLGKEMGDTLLYGVSALTPIDLSGRLGLGNLIPGTALLKPSGEQGRARDVLEVVGPAGGLVGQVADAYDAATEGNYGKAAQNLSPKAVRDAAAAIGMVATGQATDARGRKVIDVSMTDAAAKAIGFNPTIVANQHRKSMPLQQDAALQRKMESSIAHQWAAGIVSGDQNAVNEAIARRDEWNRTNPRTKVIITPDQVRSRVKQMESDKAARVAKSLPKEMAIGLDSLAQ